MYPTAGSFAAFPINPAVGINSPRLFNGIIAGPQISQKPISNSPFPGSAHSELYSSKKGINIKTDENLEVPLPWAKNFSDSPRSLYAAGERNVPPSGSSAVKSREIITANAKVISTRPHTPIKDFLGTLLTLGILLIPLILMIWFSYYGWPAGLPLSAAYKLKIYSLINKTPLPKNPQFLFNPVTAYWRDVKYVDFQLRVTAEHNAVNQTFNSVFTGRFDLSTDNPMGFWENTFSWNSDEGNRVFMNGKFVYRNGNLSMSWADTIRATYFNWPLLQNETIIFSINPKPTEENLQKAHAPGEFALTKIRNQKIEKLLTDYGKLMMEKAVINEQNSESETAYKLIVNLTKEEWLNFIKELIIIQLESKTSATISQAAMKDFYHRLDEIADELRLEIEINKDNLELEQIKFSTKIYTDSFPELSSGADLPLGRLHFFNLAGRLTFNQADEEVEIPEIPSGKSARTVYWSEVINHPILVPLLR